MNKVAGEGLLAILGAVPFETEPFIGLLRKTGPLTCGDQTFLSGIYRERHVLVGSTGLGKVNAAVTTAALLERLPVAQVWNVGCAGAFKESPLEVGDVLITTTCIFGDEGILTRDTILPPSSLGIPIVLQDGREYYDHIHLGENSSFKRMMEKTPEGWYQQMQSDAPAVRAHPRDDAHDPGRSPVFRLMCGPSLTVGMVSGDSEVAEDRFQRHGAYAENLEGSAVAQTCLRFRVDMLECRGISNVVGNRRKEDWQMNTAVSHCHGIILNWLQG